MKVFENKVQWKIFESKDEEVKVGRRTLNDKDLHNFALQLTLFESLIQGEATDC
jgi:hypothetical protein